MRIIHCCIGNFYIDNWSYQENLLSKYNKLDGHDVKIIASVESYDTSHKLVYLNTTRYINQDGIEVVRVPYARYLPRFVMKKLRIYDGLKSEIGQYRPDIVFLHGIQTFSAIAVANFCAVNNIKFYVDSHADYTNSALSGLSRFVLHRIVYALIARIIEKKCISVYYTIPLRKYFLMREYRMSNNKMRYLPLGFDSVLIDRITSETNRPQLRESLGFSDYDIVIISGGKMYDNKNIHRLVRAVQKIRATNTKIKLLIYGSLHEEMAKCDFTDLDYVHYVGWLSQDEIIRYTIAADIGFIAGKHSVYWEQLLGLRKPSICLRKFGHEHIDVNKNVVWMENTSENEFSKTLTLISNCQYIALLNERCKEMDIERFDYKVISRSYICN
jgi:1,2-diacylglycerol 3-alpha-glucosyltransferase